MADEHNLHLDNLVNLDIPKDVIQAADLKENEYLTAYLKLKKLIRLTTPWHLSG